MNRIIYVLIGLLLITGISSAGNLDSLITRMSLLPDDSVKVDALNEISIIYSNTSPDSAVFYGDQAIELAESVDYSSGKAKALKLIGNCLWNMGRYDEAVENYYISLNIYKTLNDSNGICRLENNIGLIYITQKNLDQAIVQFNRSIEISEATNNLIMAAKTTHNLGISYFEMEMYDSVMQYNNKALKLYDKIDDPIGVARVYNSIGQYFAAINQLDSAKIYLQKGLEINLRLNNPNDVSMINNQLAEMYLKTKSWNKAIIHANEAYLIADRIDSRFNKLEAAYSLGEAYAKLEDFKQACFYQKMSNVLIDSMFNERSQAKLARLQANYENEKKLRIIEAEHLKKELASQNAAYTQKMWLYGVLSALIIILIITFFLHRSNLNKKRANILLERQKDIIHNSNEKLEFVNSELSELNKTKDKFFSIMAHDLKNPIGSFKGMTEMLTDDYDKMNDEERIEFITVMKNSSVHLYSLLENLLTWSRAQHGNIDCNPESCQLRLLADMSARVLYMASGNKNITITVNIPEEYTVYVDYMLTETIIRNIVSNSIKFTPQGGTILLSAHQKGSNIILSIKDSGRGMDQLTVDKLFKIGESKSTPGTNEEKGTGLGLIICKEFTDMNKGTIRVESELGHGSEFIISLPAAVII